jgi:hypothetical protein
MGNIDNYDEKAAYNQRSHSQHSKSTSYSPISSSASSNSCTDDKHDYNKLDACPCSHPYQKIADAKQRESGQRVKFMVEKPLPPGWVMNWNWDVERKMGSGNEMKSQDRRKSTREKEDEWWRNGGQGLVPYDSDDEDDDDEDLNKEKYTL